jgi:hypothetical protein
MTKSGDETKQIVGKQQVSISEESKPELEMLFDINVIENLGLKMYTSLPAVISEYIANSWDAGATLVEITIPEGPISENYTISICDNGSGMAIKDVNHKFLRIGRKKREEEKTDVIDVEGHPRPVMGRKGIGKLAGFGIAGWVEVRTHKDGRFIDFRMDYERMQQEAKKTIDEKIKAQYQPDVLDWGNTAESQGTIIRLSHLKRDRAVDINSIRKNIARHFTVISNSFVIKINETEITLDERDLQNKCQFVWRYEEAPISDGSTHKVTGWIGTMKDPVPPEIGRGVVIMVRGRLGQTPSTLDVGGTGITGQTGLAYMVGEVNADFLDDEKDSVATGRMAIVWEDEPASTFRTWLNSTIKDVCRDWVKLREEFNMKNVREIPEYKHRIACLPKHEKQIIDKILLGLAKRENVDSDTLVGVANYLAEGVEYKSFMALSQAIIEAEVLKPEALIEFFQEWEVLDAIEMIRVVEGRVNVLSKFRELIKARVKEIPDLHNFIVDNPWLLDPAWNYLDDEVYYSDSLWKRFPEPEDLQEENKRMDFLCLGYGITLNIIELKRPGCPIGKEELRQLEDYVDYVKTLLGTSPTSYRNVIGYVIGGKIVRNPEVVSKVERYEEHCMYIRTFADLESVAWRVHYRFLEVLERKAKRMSDSRITEGLERLKISIEQSPEQKLEQQGR